LVEESTKFEYRKQQSQDLQLKHSDLKNVCEIHIAWYITTFKIAKKQYKGAFFINLALKIQCHVVKNTLL